ncbi:hypothetical protein RBSWK_00114 [Rhodopirellula baltica SWK14]|uniref:Uncharacterized protein n=1 Tax=Rhodopirellula baltica SWK14 TaxID=993516 RepID=L7CQF6_RHOBT|nr:hypothetical protein RBSWK_00114 [Rhodopirellula baltica SWK14]
MNAWRNGYEWSGQGVVGKGRPVGPVVLDKIYVESGLVGVNANKNAQAVTLTGIS